MGPDVKEGGEKRNANPSESSTVSSIASTNARLRANKAWSCGLQTWRTGSAARASLTMVIVSETVLCNRANKIEKRSPRAIAEMCGAQGMRAKHGSAKTSRQRNQWAIEKHQRCYIISNRGHPSSPSLSFRCKWTLIYRAYILLNPFYRSWLCLFRKAYTVCESGLYVSS